MSAALELDFCAGLRARRQEGGGVVDSKGTLQRAIIFPINV